MFATQLLSLFHQLRSDHPIGFLAELDLTNVSGPLLRYTNEREDIIFHGNTFLSVPFHIQEFGQGTSDSPKHIEVVVGNGNLLMSSLKEQFFRGRIHPLWVTRLWLVDMRSPDTTPASHHAAHRVIALNFVFNSETNIDVCQLRLANDTISATRNMRAARYIPPRFPGMRFT